MRHHMLNEGEGSWNLRNVQTAGKIAVCPCLFSEFNTFFFQI